MGTRLTGPRCIYDNYASASWIPFFLQFDFVASAALLLGTLGVLLAQFNPALHPNLGYGKTHSLSPSSFPGSLLRITVPRHWFWHFYLCGTGFICWTLASTSPRTTASTILLVQCCRRLLEELFLFPKSTSVMQITHYIAGLGFYAVQGLSSPCINQTHTTAWQRTIAVPIFVACWVLQAQCHRVLASTVKYHRPAFPVLSQVACPHYTFEIGIYSALTIVEPHAVRWASLLWVCSSLAVSALQNRDYYNKRGANLRYAIVPGLL